MLAQIIPARRMPLALEMFEYDVPTELESRIKIGQLVEIPFQKHNEFGIVYQLSKNSLSGRPLKLLNKIISENPFISQEQLGFLNEMAQFYHTPLGFIVKQNLPPLQKRKLGSLAYSGAKKSAINIVSAKPKLFVYSSQKQKKSFINDNVSIDGQTLILVPEIGDIDRMTNVFDENMKKKVAVISSDLSEKEFFNVWMEVWTGQKSIILGTRRAIFMPYFNLRSIILDDEGNSNYKSWDMAPRFNTRDAALFLSTAHGAVLTMMSHTPSVESYFFAKHKIYDLNSDAYPYQNFEFINLKDEWKGGNKNILGEDLAGRIKNTTGVSFLYLNRKGTLNYVACRDCKTVSSCPTCERPLAYHEAEALLKCHHCGYSESISLCKKCGGSSTAMYGAGIALLEKEVKGLLKGTGRQIVRLDKENISIPEKIYEPGTVIVGTQYAWSKLNWERLSLMTFVDADISLFVPEYKITEQLWQLLRDARFRLAQGATVYVQTSHPEHRIFQALMNPENFYTQELTERKMFGYPPFNFLIRFYKSAQNKAQIEADAKSVFGRLSMLTKGNLEIKIHPAMPMFPTFYRRAYWQVILAKVSYKNYKKNTKFLLSKLPNGWKVDPNPNTILSV